VIVLHQFQISPFCDKIRRVLHWKGLDYQVREVPVSGALRIRRINRAGKLPCLEHDGQLVADSTDIAHYLERSFPEPPLLPKDPAQRGLCHLLEDWADESLYFTEMYLRFALPHNAERWIPELVHADPPMVKRIAPLLVPALMRRATRQQGVGRKTTAQVLADLGRHLDGLSAWLGERSWLVGDALSLADLAVFAQLFCICGAREGEEMLAERPALAAWMERVDEATVRR
jgi:glutathione S-transferase